MHLPMQLLLGEQINDQSKGYKGNHEMNANTIISEEMSLEEKLAAIDAAMANAQAQANEEAAGRGQSAAPLDPALLTICDGCE